MSVSNAKKQIIVRQPEDAPRTMSSVASMFAEAKALGFRSTLVLHEDSPENGQILARRQHDVRASLRTLDLSVKALTSGYRFADELAQAKIAAIHRAVQCLEREVALLSAVLQAE
ncbi:MAG: hypothetical protein FJ146_04825 [Deltaproteobacteria bacterium]|nr:hypothetical protein [Deltaproteobacteria bacterium]